MPLWIYLGVNNQTFFQSISPNSLSKVKVKRTRQRPPCLENDFQTIHRPPKHRIPIAVEAGEMSSSDCTKSWKKTVEDAEIIVKTVEYAECLLPPVRCGVTGSNVHQLAVK